MIDRRKRPPACGDPFAPHVVERTHIEELGCGHQRDVLPCGCVLNDDHKTEPCDGRSVAELEKETENAY